MGERITAIFQSNNPAWIEENPNFRIYEQIEQILSDDSIREVHVVTAWMSIQALDAFTALFTEIAERNGARVVFVLGNQPPLNRLTDEAVFERLLTWDQNYESIEAYVHSAGTGNKIFHPKFFCFKDRQDNWRMIAGSSNMTLSGLGIESGTGNNPNTEFVLVGNLEGDTRNQVLNILSFLEEDGNSIRLNSNTGITFVERYRKTRLGGNGAPSGTTLEQDQQESDNENEELLDEELPGEELPGEELPGEELPDEELPGEELPGEEEQGLFPLPRDLSQLNHQLLVRYIHHYSALTQGDGDSPIANMWRYRGTYGNYGHYHRQIALVAHYIIDAQPFAVMNLFQGTEYPPENLARVRTLFRDWITEIEPHHLLWTTSGGDRYQSVGDIRAIYSRGWTGSDAVHSPYIIPRALHWIANHLWSDELNPAD